MTKEIVELITCDRPVLEVGRRYEISIYDMDLYEGYSDDHELVQTKYITYEGGDIANYFMKIGKEYALNDVLFIQEKWGDLGDFVHEVRNARQTDDHYHADLIFEMYTTKSPVRTFEAIIKGETKDEPFRRIELALHVHKYNEPNFINLR
jgi:hypothetical protein